MASLVGTWIGTVTGHSGYPPQRPIPITWFELCVDQSPPESELTRLAASWSDNAGCRGGTGYPYAIFGLVRDPRSISVGVEGLACNDGDFYLNETANEEIRVVTGTCPLGGPTCQFRMVRQ